MEFHVSRRARDRYQFDQTLFQLNGNVVFANFHAARLFAQRMNQMRNLVHFPEQVVKAGQLNAMGLIDEILHYVVGLYRQQRNPNVMQQALEWLNAQFGQNAVDATLRQFVDEFPPLAVYRNELSPDAYLAGHTGEVPNRQLILEEMVMLGLANTNPASAPLLELFDDTQLARQTAYAQLMIRLRDFFDSQPFFGPDDQNLVDMLREPAMAVPHSLEGQLDYIRQRWGAWLGPYFERLIYRLLISLDLIREEQRIILPGPGPARVYEYRGLELEFERYSPDRDWMPNLVLIAKNTYVWLDQLSRKYGRSITRLDQIPDQELDTLAGWGFSGLWLIGLWERSRASQKIKQMCGNPEAVASAYSLLEYRIADDLGGEPAYQHLKERAWRRGIRLASDMVPNHMAIDSRWVIEHPDWFISLDRPPFVAYSFNGPDLSWDERVGIYLEDHYYTRSDAAVVFKRVDRRTGSERYIYHGNDGTSMPWNDTAQLNYLNPEVREAVIQTILHVARQFPIIRFDAAMTLTKRHYQRLWFPEPGTGGAIPSRAEHGLTKAEFDAHMPNEFWREVVDRVAQEAPDTLLLAEAFWLMEGYFVRTLGMHRVYNSAFMNMLRDEENTKYRSVIKNTLEFDPEILKRFVNFMNNPDERTAIDQFGKDDKYFGVCMLMATMPGLPMFGHGQIEGFAEKYGMEYRRAYWDETPDSRLIERHAREIFPMLRQRYLFADVQHFRLYDFCTADGWVNEDVFAYSNRVGHQRAVVVYHNRFASAAGWIRRSVAYSVKTGQGDERALVQQSLAEGLALQPGNDRFCIFRDHVSGLEYIRSHRELFEQGLYVELGAYKYHVFVDFREVQDDAAGHYAQLAAYLCGRGVPSIQQALTELLLQPVHNAFAALVNADMLRRISAFQHSAVAPDASARARLMDEVTPRLSTLLAEIQRYAGDHGDTGNIARQILGKLAAVLRLAGPQGLPSLPGLPPCAEWLEYLRACLPQDDWDWAVLIGWLFSHALGQVIGPEGAEQRSRSWLDEWLLGRWIADMVQHHLGASEAAAWRAVALIKGLVVHPSWHRRADSAGVSTSTPQGRAYRLLQSLLSDDALQQFLHVNRYQDILWFNKESFQQLMEWLFVTAVIEVSAAPVPNYAEVDAAYETILALLRAQQASDYQVEKLLEAARQSATEQEALPLERERPAT